LRRRWRLKGLRLKFPSFGELKSWRKTKKRFNFYLGILLFVLVFVVLGYAILFTLHDFQSRKISIDEDKDEVKVKVEAEEEAKIAVLEEVPKARVAIILDDAGDDTIGLDDALSIRSSLTISILPGLPSSALVARKVRDSGKEVMLHLPMEPENGKYVRVDGSMILAEMQDSKIKEIVKNSLKDVPGAVGINNHMGSKATQVKRVMQAVLEVAKEKGLYFIDSRTSRTSIAYDVAKDMGLKCSENYIFLDVDTSSDVVEERLAELVTRAKRRGKAIGIGHITRKTTLDILKRKMPEYEASGIKFVFASEVVK